jgi:hypothetical protein
MKRPSYEEWAASVPSMKKAMLALGQVSKRFEKEVSDPIVGLVGPYHRLSARAAKIALEMNRIYEELAREVEAEHGARFHR